MQCHIAIINQAPRPLGISQRMPKEHPRQPMALHELSLHLHAPWTIITHKPTIPTNTICSPTILVGKLLRPGPRKLAKVKTARGRVAAALACLPDVVAVEKAPPIRRTSQQYLAGWETLREQVLNGGSTRLTSMRRVKCG